MDEAKVRILIDTIEQSFQKLGAQNLDEAAAVIDKLIDFFSNQVKPLMNRQVLESLLRSTESTPENEQLLMTMLEQLPLIVALFLQNLSTEASKTFPNGNGGRPRSLNAANRRELCQHIAKLHGEGVSLGTAKARASQKYGVSVSTVERIWAERKNGHKPSPEELFELIKLSTAKS